MIHNVMEQLRHSAATNTTRGIYKGVAELEEVDEAERVFYRGLTQDFSREMFAVAVVSLVSCSCCSRH